MPKVKIAPNLYELVRPLEAGDLVPRQYDPEIRPNAQKEFRALLAVARAVIRWRYYDGDGDGITVPADEAKLMGAMVNASLRLDRISGRKR